MLAHDALCAVLASEPISREKGDRRLWVAVKQVFVKTYSGIFTLPGPLRGLAVAVSAVSGQNLMARSEILVVALAVLLVLSACGQVAPPPTAQIVTMDGSDPATGATIQTINVFDKLPGGRKIGTVQSGARVTLLAHTGAVAQIETPEGLRGYVAAAFIKELR